MLRIILLLCLFCVKSYSMDFVAEEGKYQMNLVKDSFVYLNNDQLKCINAALKESSVYDPTKGGKMMARLPIPDRRFILKDKRNKELWINVSIQGKSNKIVYINLTVPEKEKEKLDQLVRTLEKALLERVVTIL